MDKIVIDSKLSVVYKLHVIKGVFECKSDTIFG